MLAGLIVCVYYIVSTYPFFTQMTGFSGAWWFGIESISSGVFGVPAGFVVAVVVSLVDQKPDAYTRALMDCIRHP
ncbi:Na+/solute symporter [Caballeronia udeis]|uniref:Na+/solute symporter n=1 Tax=Caballeronia udeis TaxID=1232866 RepID=A0A158JH54_9BURK|nr:Na+/solute symporter [Caballeronia udeis]